MDDNNSPDRADGVEVEALTPSVDSSDRRTSLERFRDVGKTFTQGISALREHLVVKYPFSNPPDTSELSSCPSGAPPAPDGPDAGTSTAPSAPVTGCATSASRAESSSHDEVRELSALLEAAGLRERNLRMNIRHLRAESEAQTRAATRADALIAELRSGYDALAARARTAGASVDVARLRTECVALESELARVRGRAAEKDARATEERRKRTALEKVCMRLRERVARAERDAERGKKLEEAVIAREAAEAKLGEAKAEVEHLRVRVGGVRAATERAEVAERAERALRARVDNLVDEVQTKEDSARKYAADLRVVRRELRECRRAVSEKEEKIRRLVRIVGDTGSSSSAGSGRSGGSGGSGRRRRVERAERRLREFTEEMEGVCGIGDIDEVASTESTTHSDESQGQENSVSSMSGNWNDVAQERRENARRKHTASTRGAIPESSPLLREVERTHAQLKSVFHDSEDDNVGTVRRGNAGYVSQDNALLERLRRFE